MSDRPTAALTVRLSAIGRLARDTNLYTFERADGAALPDADAGAHIILQLPNRLVRQYSIVDPAKAPRSSSIGVKREADSRGGSKFLHEAFRVGETLRILPPRNLFPLDETAPTTVLFAGGIGITPIYAMAQRLRQIGRAYTLHYAARTREDMAFHDELSRDPNARLHFDTIAGGPLPLAQLIGAAPRDAHLYCCGPQPMLAAFEAAAATDARPPAMVHVEYFKPKE